MWTKTANSRDLEIYHLYILHIMKRIVYTGLHLASESCSRQNAGKFLLFCRNCQSVHTCLLSSFYFADSLPNANNHFQLLGKVGMERFIIHNQYAQAQCWVLCAVWVSPKFTVSALSSTPSSIHVFIYYLASLCSCLIGALTFCSQPVLGPWFLLILPGSLCPFILCILLLLIQMSFLLRLRFLSDNCI